MTQATFDDDAITEPSSVPLPREAFPPAPGLPWRALGISIAATLFFWLVAAAVADAVTFIVDYAALGEPLYALGVVASGAVVGAMLGAVAVLCWRRS